MRCRVTRVYGMRGRRTPRGATMVAGALAAWVAAGAASSPRAQEPTPPAETLKHAFPAQKSYSPYAGRNYPTRVYAALKDPMSGNLDRIQVIKGWVDAQGGRHEKVHDVAGSGGRKPDPRSGKLPPAGNTVDVANATWTNTIGAPELIAVWKDPEFDTGQRAVYYARVIEIPTPRWTAYDARRFGVKLGPEVPMTTQERAYTSPIWYTPGP